MTNKEVCDWWLNKRQELTARAEVLRDSMSVVYGLAEEYERLTDENKCDVQKILANWLVSEDSDDRYDAAFLIGHFKISSLSDAVEKAIKRCDSIEGPEALYEGKKLRRILAAQN